MTRLEGRSARLRRKAAGVGWMEQRVAGLAGPRARARGWEVLSGQWEVLALRPAWGWDGRGQGRGQGPGLRCQLQGGGEPRPGSVTAATAGNMEPPDVRAGLLWLTFLLSGYSGMTWG